jgi:outer membrane lipoprotein carrier protein
VTRELLLTLLLALQSVSGIGATSAPARAQLDAADILERAAERHRGLSSLQVAFTQRIQNPVLQTDETSSGVFYYKAPLSYRIAFTRPAGDVVVSTGEDVWIYLPSSQPDQVIKSAVTPGTKGLAPYQFIFDFKDQYEPALVGEEPVEGRPSYHLSLTPLSEAADYARAEMWIDKQVWITRQMEVEDRQGIVRRFTLSDHRLDVSLDPSLFRFKPPKGAEVFEQ